MESATCGSASRWRGGRVRPHPDDGPRLDTAIGLTPRVQLARACLGWPAASDHVFQHQVAVYATTADLRWRSDRHWRSHKSDAAGQRRVEWGVPVSAQIDRGSFGSTAAPLFLAGDWVCGSGHRPVGERPHQYSTSFSHAWRRRRRHSWNCEPAQPRRMSCRGASYDLKPNVAVFGSISRTLGVAAEEGAGTTLGFGLSWSVAPSPSPDPQPSRNSLVLPCSRENIRRFTFTSKFSVLFSAAATLR